MTIRVIKTKKPLTDPAVLELRDRLRGAELTAAGELAGLNVPAIVSAIIADVRGRKDQALIDWERKLDKAELTADSIRVPLKRIKEAHSGADPAFMKLIRRVIDNIWHYQQSILVEEPPALNRQGRQLGVRYTPIDRVGLYVPGGKAVLSSSLLMSAVPAQVAGVGQIAIACPPTCDGDINPMVLAIAGELNIDEVYRLGGAVAIAGLAYGTESVTPVDKIIGPGSAFVAEAKRQVFGWVGIDSIAGPSEVFIVADETADPAWLAADLLAQAEHDPGSAILATPSQVLADKVAAQIEAQAKTLARAKETLVALEAYSGIFVTPTMDDACALANEFAPEHLQIITADDDAALSKIRHAGAIFLGPYSPVPLGDYYAGPSHILPTGGGARFFGPLSCNDFRKASSVIRYDGPSLAEDAADIMNFATREGLTAHARAVKFRQDEK